MDNIDEEISEESIAIIGMSGRFPGAKNIDEFWQNLKNGVESISFFSDQELIDSGIDPALLKDNNYVKAKGALDNVADFDAAFFGMSPKEAEIMDPQQRLFLECAWEAFENAGYDPKAYPNVVGVYGGVGGFNTYLLENIQTNQELRKTIGDYQIAINNNNDFVCTHVSFKLNLCGPGVSVQTACSTSLVAVAMGYQSLLDYQCDVVLAGGAAITLPQKSGYLYQQGMILSPDGHCRAFDAKAQGTVSGNGVGIVVLKRLRDALAEGDTIHAVIRGAAINNDGALKFGYTAPNVDAQTRVIAEALTFADISPETLSYIETHGTGTPIGDPIEIAALTQAFRAKTDKKGFCAIGSVKTNIGHLDAASGVTGLIKTVLALKHQLIPPNLHFETPNPKLDLVNSPFYVNTKLSAWETAGIPRRAAVSSFGVGGTNAHVILEEAPNIQERQIPPTPPLSKGGILSNRPPYQLLLLSTKTDTALETATTQLAQHLKQHSDINLADVAYTYQVGRSIFNHRRMLVCKTVEDTVNALETQDDPRVLSQTVKNNDEPAIVFMFSGQGAQYVNMGLELYQTETVFREQVDHCAELLKPHLGLDLRNVLYPELQISPNPSLLKNEKHSSKVPPFDKGELGGISDLKQTAITQPALFVIEYALAQLWQSWGVHPKAMIGHSIGEYVAACLAGVLTLEEALTLVAERGRLIQTIPAGAMLAVPLSETEIRPLLNHHVDLAAINISSQSVVSGTFEAVVQLVLQLAEQGVECQHLQTSHAFHSEMMVSILPDFLKKVQQIPLKPPQIPFISNVTGTWISEPEATDPNYWVKHLRQTVCFAAGLQPLLQESPYILLEVGPGRTLSTFAKRHPDNTGQLVLTSLHHPKDEQSDSAFILNNLGQLWMAGVTINWSGFYADEPHYRLPLPTYPFDRQRYWIEAQTQGETVKPRSDWLQKKPDIADWFYIPSWKRTAPPVYDTKSLTEPSCWLVFMDECGLGSQLVTRLQQQNQDVITVTVGEQFTGDAQRYTLNPHQRNDYDTLLQELLVQNKIPKTIIHLWTVSPNNETKSGLEWLDKSQDLGFYSLLFLAQALGKQNITDTLKIEVVSTHLHAVTGEEKLCPEKATLLGPCKVIPQEYSNIICRSIDVILPKLENLQEGSLINQILSEIVIKQSDTIIAYRNNNRWVQTFEPVCLEQTSEMPLLREKGVYLITGGLGGIGLVLAEYLAKTIQPKLILTMRSAFPEKKEWQQWLATHSNQDNVSCKILKIQSIESLGAEILIISADVANIKQMQAAITQSLKRFNHIHGVIHTAGVSGGGTIQRKTKKIAENILIPKVQGTWVLDTVFKDIQLDFMVLCSSLTSILGGFGQVDYCAANIFLDTFAHYNTTKNGSFTVSIGWDGWQKVGMAVEAAKQHVGTVNVQDSKTKKVFHPLFDQYMLEGGNKEIYITYLSVLKHWVLAEHKVMEKPTLPGTVYLEMARAAFENSIKNNGNIIEISEVYFLTPLTVGENEEKEVRTVLTKLKNGYEFVISSQANSKTWQEHARGQIAYIDEKQPKKYELKALEEKCQNSETVFSQNVLTTSAKFIEFGPRWNNLKQVKYGQNQGLAFLELPEQFVTDLNEYKLHPALLDVAASFTMVRNENAYLPFSYKKLRIKKTLPAKFYSYITFVENNPSNMKLNVNIMDEQGRGLVEIEDYILRRADAATDKSEKQQPILESENFHLEIASPGLLDTLTFQPATRQKPGQGEVEIEVSATGLNFKEVLWALGILPSDGPIQFGLECAGKIVAFGKGVKGFQIGDEVMAFTNAGFSAYVTVSASSVVLKPKHLTMEEAATIPITFMTAYYALHHLGRLCQGERVLIHAATGGVGLAAVQVAKMIGAKIFATAGNPEKRAFLHSLGIEHVMDSRTLDFADAIMAQTHGQGVNVVLNSLAGDFIPKSLSVLAPFGRFLEIGKRDIYENSPLGLRTFEKSRSFFAIDVGTDIPNFSALFNELIQHFKDQCLSPLPYQIFPITEIMDAFKYMAQAKHIGKIVVSQDKRVLKTLASGITHQLEQVYQPVANDTLHEMSSADTNIFQKDLKEGLLPTEGIEVFKRIVHSKISQIVVSTRDLKTRLEKDTASNILASLKDSTSTHLPKSAHSRPQLNNVYIAPRNEFEQAIAEVWKKFLGIEQIGIHDDFFELGGDSLIAVQVVAELRRTIQVELSAHSLLEKTTIATLADLIKPTSINNRQISSQILPSSLVKIQSGNPLKRAIFLVHPVGGHVYVYRDLARCLGTEQPVYGLQAQDIDLETASQTQINKMATRYIEALRTIQSEGPYLLGGSSFGGVVAFEMAQQLHAIGQKVALLALIDAAGPGYMPIEFEDDVDILAYLLMVGDNDSSVSAEKIRHLNSDERIKYFLAHGKTANKLLPGQKLEEFHDFMRMFESNLQALRDYRVKQTYPGKIVFFRATEREEFNHPNPERGWFDLAKGGVKVYEVPGNHITMNYSPHVEVMAKQLKTYLD
jgi:acyl transferase domain-containing protein/thioesterase domain-containing protein/acyl carrier protein